MNKADIDKLKEKIAEGFNDNADPVVVERVNQIVNDALASMPPSPKEEDKDKEAETPEDAMVRRLNEQVDAVAAANDPKSDLVATLKKVAAEVEAAVKAGDKPASKPHEQPKPKAHEPEHDTKKKS